MKINLKGILGVLRTIAETAVAVLPIVRQFFPKVEEAVDQLEDVVEQGGEEAAQWINEHPEVINALITIGDRMSDVGAAVKTAAIVARGAAADNIVTPPEAEAFLRALDLIRKSVADADDIEAAIATVTAAK